MLLLLVTMTATGAESLDDAFLKKNESSNTHGSTSKAMKNSTMMGSKKADTTFYDYIVVGSGPGGATVARLLSDNPDNMVLLLEAGENRDNDPPITDSADAWIGKLALEREMSMPVLPFVIPSKYIYS